MESNPKSALADKNRPHHNQPNEKSSVRVTFAKASNQFAISSKASMVPNLPFPKVAPKPQASPKVPVGNQKNRTTTEAKGKTTGTGTQKQKEQKPGSSGRPNTKNNNQGSNNKKPVVAKVSDHSLLKHQRKQTFKSPAGREPGRKDVQHRPLSTRSAIRMRALPRSTSSHSGNSPKRTKSRKNLKQKRSSSTNDASQPAHLDPEYASELSKITQILKAVTIFDVTTSTGNATIQTGSSPRVKMSPHMATDRFLEHKSVHRPLSTGEIKQLLSSITRVVSLHQLPINGHASSNQNEALSLEKSASSLPKSKLKEKKSKREKGLAAFPKSISRKDVRSKSSSRFSSRSKESLKRGRSKRKHPKRTNSDGSSISSSEKDPVKHAAFLKQYFEESTRLADKNSSEDIVTQSQPQTENEHLNFEREQSRRSPIKPHRNHGASTKGFSKVSVVHLPSQKELQGQKSSTTSNPFKATLSGDVIENELTKNTPDLLKSQNPVITATSSSRPDIEKRTNDFKLVIGNEASSNLSTTAVAGSPKPRSPIAQADDKSAIASKQDKERSAKGRTRIIDPTINKALRQQQIKNVEEIINSKFKGNTAKMKSIWEKTSQTHLPITHSRFYDALYGGETETEQDTPGTLLAHPIQRTFKQRPVENVRNDKVTQPKLNSFSNVTPFPEASKAYSRLNYDEYRENMRREARQIRKRFGDDAIRSFSTRPKTVPTREEYLGRSGSISNNIDEAFKYYSSLISRDVRK